MAEELPTDESTDEHLEELKEDVEPWLPTGGDMDEILEAAAEGISVLDSEIVDAAEGARLQNAESEAELERHGWPVEAYPIEDESNDVYRKRIQTNFEKLTRRGSPLDIVQFTSDLFGVNTKRVDVDNIEDSANFRISVKKNVLDNAVGSKEKAIELITDITAATYGVKFLLGGAFSYTTEKKYKNDNYNPDYGYATLDSDGDIVNGGEYSTIY